MTSSYSSGRKTAAASNGVDVAVTTAFNVDVLQPHMNRTGASGSWSLTADGHGLRDALAFG